MELRIHSILELVPTPLWIKYVGWKIPQKVNIQAGQQVSVTGVLAGQSRAIIFYVLSINHIQVRAVFRSLSAQQYDVFPGYSQC